MDQQQKLLNYKLQIILQNTSMEICNLKIWMHRQTGRFVRAVWKAQDVKSQPFKPSHKFVIPFVSTHFHFVKSVCVIVGWRPTTRCVCGVEGARNQTIFLQIYIPLRGWLSSTIPRFTFLQLHAIHDHHRSQNAHMTLAAFWKQRH